ncbi:MAG: hypothetical protein ACXV7J_07840 [Methylomonas sp.]
MMTLDATLVILLVEALVAMILLCLAIFFISRGRRSKEMVEIEQFIGRLDEEEAVKAKLLESILIENCGIDRNTAAVTLKEVSDAERALLQRIIQLFLQRETALLGEIDQLIANLSDPYCKLLAAGASSPSVASTASGSETMSSNKAAGLERINQQLVRQLETAMKTIDEITAEYTRVFSGNQTALELENSSKKMQQIFYDIEHEIKANMSDLQS